MAAAKSSGGSRSSDESTKITARNAIPRMRKARDRDRLSISFTMTGAHRIAPDP